MELPMVGGRVGDPSTLLQTLDERVKGRAKYSCEKKLNRINCCAIISLMAFAAVLCGYGIKEKNVSFIAQGAFGVICSPMFFCSFKSRIKEYYDIYFRREEYTPIMV
jgi:hypothetical protein